MTMTKGPVLDWLRGQLTEERTDRALDALLPMISKRLPWWVPTKVVRAVLDALLPELLIHALDRALPYDAAGVA